MSAHPTTLGPYTLLEMIGRDGAATVFAGRHTLTGATADVVLVAATGPAAATARREIRTLLRARHPRIVPVVDTGLDGDMPWYATEVCEGATLPDRAGALRKEIADATPVERRSRVTAPLVDPRDRRPRSLSDIAPAAELHPTYVRFVVDVAIRLCAPLALLHGEGLVVGHLAPDGIVVPEAGAPVLRNLAVGARVAAREGAAWTSEHVAYLAPETLRADRCDARADLYSVGCIMYELLAGRPPFSGPPSRVGRAHVESRPIALGRHARGVPAALEEIVARLLEKEPQARFRSAEDLAAALEPHGDPDSDPGARPRRTLLRARTAGRGYVLAALEGRILRIEDGAGGAVLLTGPAGSGKTRVIEDAARAAAERGAFVAVGRAVEDLCGPPPVAADSFPLAALRAPLRAIAKRCIALGAFESNRVVGHRGPVLALVEPTVASLPGQDGYPPPVAFPPDAARIRLFSYLAETLSAVAEDHRVILFLDDLHHADELTTGFLEYAVGRGALAGRSILVVGAVDPDESDRAAAILSSAGSLVLPLAPLTAEETTSILAESAGAEVLAGERSAAIALSSAGDPLRASALAELAVNEGDLDGALACSSTRAVLGHQASTLDGPRLAAAGALAVLGTGASHHLVTAVAGLPLEEGFDAIAELIRRRIVLEPVADRLRLNHEDTAAAILRRLGDDEVRRLYGVAAATLARYDGAADAVVGHLAKLGGNADVAASSFLRAARRAAALGALAAAGRFYDKFFALSPNVDERLLEARLDHASDVLARTDDAARTAAEIERAIAEARVVPSPSLEMRGLRLLATARFEAGDAAASRELFAQAGSLARGQRNRAEEVAALRGLAMVDAAVGLLDRARSHYEQALAAVIAIGDKKEEAALRSTLAVVCAEAGDLLGALGLFESGYALAKEIGDLRVEASVLANLGLLYQHGGHLDQARQAYEGALANLRTIGNRRNEALTLANMGTLYELAGRDLKALDLFVEALAIHRQVGNERGAGLALQRIAGLEARKGRMEDARAHIEEALALMEKVGTSRDRASALVDAATIARRARDAAGAASALRRAQALADTVGDPALVVACLCEEGHQTLASGRPSGALVAHAADLARSVGEGEDSDLGQAVARLRRANHAFETEDALLEGECPDDIPRALRRWMLGDDG